MKPRPVIFLLTVLFAVALSSCKDFIEPSLSKRTVNLLAPGALYQSKTYAVNFWWDEVEDATGYRLQIVTPGFNPIGALFADTLVHSNKFLFNLAPGDYQWRVRAENGSSQSSFSASGTFTVLPSSIKQQFAILSSPANNSLFNTNIVNLQWGALYGAINYRLQIDTANFADTTKLFYNARSPLLQTSMTFSDERSYQWRIRGENDTAQSRWSEIRNFAIDRTPPVQVILNAPEQDKVVTLPVSLQWAVAAGASRYKLYVLKSDSTTAYNPSFPVSQSTTSYNFNLGNSGDRVYWKVSAIDAAGNEGTASKLRSFVLQ
jgi:hypothetical protein